MAGVALQAPVATVLSNAVTVDASNANFTHRATGNRAIPPNTGHDMADINDRYAEVVRDVLFPASNDGKPDRARLVLESVEMVQVIGQGFVSFDITEQLTAHWALYGPQENSVIARVSVTGSGEAKSGAGKGIPENAKRRMTQAYQTLLTNTAAAFQNSADFRRFAAVPDLYLRPDQRKQAAQRYLAATSPADRDTITDAILHVAILEGDAELLALARSNKASLSDESSLLHPAIITPSFDDALIIDMITRSRDLETIDADGMSPLEASLAYGRDKVAVALIKAGAHPRINYTGNAYVSAEITYRLLKQLAAAGETTAEIASAATNLYQQAIEDANFAIQRNEASVFAARIMQVVGPILQYQAALGEARLEARAAADASPVGLGFGNAEFRLRNYDTKTPAQAIDDLRGLVSDCQARIQELTAYL